MEFSIDPKSLRHAAQQIQSANAMMQKAIIMVDVASGSLEHSMNSYGVIAERLKGNCRDLRKVSSKAGKLKRSAVKISFIYSDAERDIKNRKEGFLEKVAWGVVTGGLGTLGKVVKVTKAAYRGETAKVIKNTAKLIKKVGKVVIKKAKNDKSVKWRDIVVETSFDVKKAAEQGPLDWVLSIGESAYENYKEHGGFTPRWARETGTEAVLEVGKDLIIGSLVAAGVAVVFGSNPVGWAALGAAALFGIGSAASGVAVDAGLDWIAQKCTGDSKAKWKEKVSDFICDTEEKTIKSNLKTANNLGRSVRKAWNRAVNGFTNNGSKCKWGYLAA